MLRNFVQVLGGLALLGATGAVVAACSHDNSSIFVQDVLAPQLLTNGMACVYTAQSSQATISSGVLDVAFPTMAYNPVYLVGNQLVPEVNSQQLQTETSTVTIQGAVVRITDSAGNQLTTFTRLAAATIFPSVGGVPSFAPISVTTIDQNTINSDPDIVSNVINKPFTQAGTVRLVTYVRFFGQTLGGTNVETGEFEFPVDICQGCLITFSGADVNASCALPNCLNAQTSSMTSQSVPCIPGQDAPIDCSQCIGTVKDCEGVPQTLPACGG